MRELVSNGVGKNVGVSKDGWMQRENEGEGKEKKGGLEADEVMMKKEEKEKMRAAF